MIARDETDTGQYGSALAALEEVLVQFDSTRAGFWSHATRMVLSNLWLVLGQPARAVRLLDHDGPDVPPWLLADRQLLRLDLALAMQTHKPLDIINNFFARKAIEKGADGLIAVAAGAGGHAGVKSPFALVQEIRQWFSGPLALSGAISTGDGVLAALAAGADFAYIGSAFIATVEARASEAYKQCIVDSNSDDIVYSSLFTGVHGNYLKPSIRNAGLDPDQLPESDPSKMNFGGDKTKAWKDIWGCGQGIGAVKSVVPAGELVARLKREYQAARQRVLAA